MALVLKDGEKIVFIGDSITDCFRRTEERPLGRGYVKFFADLVMIREPEKKITIINRGIGGNTVVNLRDRWEDDLLRHQPDWISVMIGINDLHRFLRATPESVPPDLFAKTYREILERTKQGLPGCRIVLLEPFYISADCSQASLRGEVLRTMPDYLHAVRQLAAEFGARLVETHGIFQALIKTHDPDILCPEPVHPYPVGHLVIADHLYRALSG